MAGIGLKIDPGPSIYWGADIDGDVYSVGQADAPYSAATWNTFEEHAGKKVSIVHYSDPWLTWEGFGSGTRKAVDARGAITMVSLQSNLTQLNEVAEGKLDAAIEAWATKAKEFGKPMFLRLWWEMNGTWWAWGRAAKYVEAWQRFYTKLNAITSNVSMVWCPNIIFDTPSEEFLVSMYPGDAYVDWTGMDGYAGENPLKKVSEKTPQLTFEATYNKLLQVAPSKPIMIAETACSEFGLNKATWITELLTGPASVQGLFPKVKAVVWFNYNIVQGEGRLDWPIESSAAAQSAFKKAIASSYYQGGPAAAFSTGTKVPVPEGTGEDQNNVSLDLSDGSKFRAMKASFPTPPRKVDWASNADTEGALSANLQYDNRQITIEDRVVGSSASDLQTQLGYLEQKVGKINEEVGVGGTLEVVLKSGAVCVFDLLEASADYELDNAALANNWTTVTISFTAKPFWRAGLANEIAGADHVETSLPCVIGVDIAPAGDVPAVGRLVIDEDQGQDQQTKIWAIQCRHFDPSPDAALFYQAESRTPLGGAATAALSGASGGGNNTVLQGTLAQTYQAMLSTQASGGGNHLRNVGTYRVFARVLRPETNTGEVGVCLEWSEGDFRRRTRNRPVVFSADIGEGVFALIDLGLVQLSKATSGLQRWEGRILAKSTVSGDDLYVDYMMLFPVEEGFGSAKVTPVLESPSTFLARDEFDQAAGALSAKTAPVGGAWTTEGEGVDFQVTSSHNVTRTPTGTDAGEPQTAGGHRALIGGSYAAVVASVDMTTSSWTGPMALALLARWQSTTNFMQVFVEGRSTYVYKTVGGVRKQLGHFQAFEAPAAGTLYTYRLLVDAAGRWALWVGPASGALRRILTGRDADFATGGALASGKVGFRSFKQAGSPIHTYDNFFAFTPTADAAVFASQSAQISSDRARREDATGTVWAKPANYSGDYFTVPPARREGRQVRTIVKLARNNVDELDDVAIDDASFRIFWQPRGLVLPES